MTVYTLATNDFDADPAIISAYRAASDPIIQVYISAGNCSQPPTHTPESPVWPPTSGSYVSRRDWTGLDKAQEFCEQIATLLANNPSWTAYVTSPPTAFTE